MTQGQARIEKTAHLANAWGSIGLNPPASSDHAKTMAQEFGRKVVNCARKGDASQTVQRIKSYAQAFNANAALYASHGADRAPLTHVAVFGDELANFVQGTLTHPTVKDVLSTFASNCQKHRPADTQSEVQPAASSTS